jgi:hypothetical protein
MPRRQKAQGPVREFALWRKSGESFVDKGRSLAEVAKRWRRSTEPAAEVIAIIELVHLVRPTELSRPAVFAVAGGKI